MRLRERAVPVLLATVLWGAAAGAGAEPGDLDRDLEEARTLYGQARFPEAVARLEALAERLETLPDLPRRDEQLVEACLLLGLAHVALDDPAAARASFKRVLRVRPDRRLDPEVYAPKVVALFEQARVEVATDAAAASPSGSPRTPFDRRVQLLPGTRIRVTAAGASRRLTGKLVALDGATLTLDADYRGTMRIPRRSVERLEASVGRRSRAREGAILAAALGVVKLLDSCSSGDCEDAAPSLLFVGIGALAGLPFKTYDWRRVPLDEVRAVEAGRPAGRLRASLSLGFRF